MQQLKNQLITQATPSTGAINFAAEKFPINHRPKSKFCQQCFTRYGRGRNCAAPWVSWTSFPLPGRTGYCPALVVVVAVSLQSIIAESCSFFCCSPWPLAEGGEMLMK